MDPDNKNQHDWLMVHMYNYCAQQEMQEVIERLSLRINRTSLTSYQKQTMHYYGTKCQLLSKIRDCEQEGGLSIEIFELLLQLLTVRGARSLPHGEYSDLVLMFIRQALQYPFQKSVGKPEIQKFKALRQEFFGEDATEQIKNALTNTQPAELKLLQKQLPTNINAAGVKKLKPFLSHEDFMTKLKAALVPVEAFFSPLFFETVINDRMDEEEIENPVQNGAPDLPPIQDPESESEEESAFDITKEKKKETEWQREKATLWREKQNAPQPINALPADEDDIQMSEFELNTQQNRDVTPPRSPPRQKRKHAPENSIEETVTPEKKRKVTDGTDIPTPRRTPSRKAKSDTEARDSDTHSDDSSGSETQKKSDTDSSVSTPITPSPATSSDSDLDEESVGSIKKEKGLRRVDGATLKYLELRRKGKLSPVSRKPAVTRTPWTQREDNALLKGIKHYGTGQWACILDRYRDQFLEHRTSVSLKDRWRNMSKNIAQYKETLEESKSSSD